MNKTQLISAIAEKANIIKAQSAQLLDACLETVEEALLKGEEIRVLGFGTYGVKQVKEHQTRNPATGETITVKASKKPYFKFGKAFADKFNK